jgi:hypothetical protein
MLLFRKLLSRFCTQIPILTLKSTLYLIWLKSQLIFLKIATFGQIAKIVMKQLPLFKTFDGCGENKDDLAELQTNPNDATFLCTFSS